MCRATTTRCKRPEHHRTIIRSHDQAPLAPPPPPYTHDSTQAASAMLQPQASQRAAEAATPLQRRRSFGSPHAAAASPLMLPEHLVSAVPLSNLHVETGAGCMKRGQQQGRARICRHACCCPCSAIGWWVRYTSATRAHRGAGLRTHLAPLRPAGALRVRPHWTSARRCARRRSQKVAASPPALRHMTAYETHLESEPSLGVGGGAATVLCYGVPSIITRYRPRDSAVPHSGGRVGQVPAAWGNLSA